MIAEITLCKNSVKMYKWYTNVQCEKNKNRIQKQKTKTEFTKNTANLKLLILLWGPPICTDQDSMDEINKIDIFDRR